MKRSTRTFWIITGVILLLAVAVVSSRPMTKTKEVPLSQVIEEAKNGQVERIEVSGDSLLIKLKDGNAPQQTATKESSTSLKDYGIDYSQVTVTAKNPDAGVGPFLTILLANGLPILLVLGFFFWMARQQQGSNNQAMSFGKSRARLFGGETEKVTFASVAGSEEAKQELQEIVEFLKYPQKFEALGAKIPKGVLLFGPPGTGKTMLARAVAGEAGVPFFSISGSEFVEMFVGVGASRVRDLFTKAKKNSPCIIFIDEIDAVGRQRGTGMGGGHDEREQTLNQILVEMDGFEQGTNVIVMAATNRPDVLDPALLRPGRFDRRVTLDNPDVKNREAILKVHGKNKPLSDDVKLQTIARKTPGFSGADLANVMNEAAILAARKGQKTISHSDLDMSVEKVLMGPIRRNGIMTEKEKEITAYHEAGHAIVAHILPHADGVHKVTIVSRGSAGGVTWTLPEEDKHLHSVADFKDILAKCLGGRMAEQIIFGEITTGASNDLQQATNLARSMIMEYGMSERLKNRVFGSQNESIFLGRDLGTINNYSDEVAKEIDDEIADLIDEAAKRAAEVITKHRKDVEKIAAKLIKDETIDADEFIELIDGKKPEKPATPTTPEPEVATA